MYGLFTYIWLKLMVNVGKCTSPMDPMGLFVEHELTRWTFFWQTFHNIDLTHHPIYSGQLCVCVFYFALTPPVRRCHIWCDIFLVMLLFPAPSDLMYVYENKNIYCWFSMWFESFARKPHSCFLRLYIWYAKWGSVLRKCFTLELRRWRQADNRFAHLLHDVTQLMRIPTAELRSSSKLSLQFLEVLV